LIAKSFDKLSPNGSNANGQSRLNIILSPLEQMMARLACADGGNPNPTNIWGKNPGEDVFLAGVLKTRPLNVSRR